MPLSLFIRAHIEKDHVSQSLAGRRNRGKQDDDDDGMDIYRVGGNTRSLIIGHQIKWYTFIVKDFLVPLYPSCPH